MCNAEQWLELMLQAGLHPWVLQGDMFRMPTRPPDMATSPVWQTDWSLRELFGDEAAAVRTWAGGEGPTKASFRLRGIDGGGSILLIRGPRLADGVFGSVCQQGPHPGRRLFTDDLTAAMVAAARRGEDIALVLFGVRDFDLVRDGVGHLVAHRVIGDIADRLRHATASGRVYRLDGGGLAIILEGVPSGDMALYRISALVDEVFSTPVEVDCMLHRLSGRAGFALYPADGACVDDLLHAATLALSMAMRSKQSLAIRVDPDWVARGREDVVLAAEMAEAMARRQFRFHLQPIIDLHSGAVVSAEALARWSHPELGNIAPARFVPLAERQDIMLDMTIAMMRGFSRDAAEFNLPPLRIAINLPPEDLSPGRIQRLLNAIHHEDLLPLDRLTLEITESGMMNHADEGIATTVAALRGQGVKIAMDDFGTGYSSFATLGSLPIDILKIDRSLVSDVHRRPERQRILSAISLMVAPLGMLTVAEGLECVEEKEMVQSLGIDRGQGYCLGRPLDVPSFVRFCAERRVQL
ncbi:GGDEF domain-containing phosphodiesterase [Oleisolibacter albus]|uniref:GGDEF domain-containing phosphodiesterase n=1 Tax=Oleisolibacter albus TaxID=2171757 RepID=UPI000DF33A4D|nr:GGDEF domain-containing phosphodiesterase [Oleisolibacter albus]